MLLIHSVNSSGPQNEPGTPLPVRSELDLNPSATTTIVPADKQFESRLGSCLIIGIGTFKQWQNLCSIMTHLLPM